MTRYNRNTGTGRRRHSNAKNWIYPAVVIVVLAAVGGIWYHYRPSHAKQSTIPSVTSTGSSPAAQSTGNSQSDSSKSSSSSGSLKRTSSSGQTALITPWGDFVSNHFPGRDGSPTTETSACNTTPGATCTIVFTNGSQTRSLASKAADGKGSVIWNWDVKTAGFPAGSWKISAIAKLNGQTKSASDSLSLTIQ